MKNEREYQRCIQCVMDTTDTKITFDEHGVCDHCRNFEHNIKPYWKPQENRFDELEKLAAKIRKAGKVPVTAIGGAGGIKDLKQVILEAGAHAAAGGKYVCVLW